MKLRKNNQVKFRIDEYTKIALKKIMKNKNITLQFIMESLLKEIYY